MLPALTTSRNQLLNVTVTTLFALFVIMLPRYTDTAKTWFALLILGALIGLAFNFRRLGQTSAGERAFFTVLILNFVWIAFCYYANGEPGRGASFLWGRHFYLLFLIPVFFLFRRFEISDRMLVSILFCSVVVSFTDISVDLLQGVDHRLQGMNRRSSDQRAARGIERLQKRRHAAVRLHNPQPEPRNAHRQVQSGR